MRPMCCSHARSLFVAALVTIAVPSAPARAQAVLVAPNVVILDGRTRTTAITLVNTGNAPAEVNLTTAFGYPVTDSSGAMRLETFESVSDTMPSAAEFVHAYPSQFMLAPGARRVVRLLATPPANTRDGEYWARLVVTTRSARPAVSELETPGAARVGLDLEIRSLLPLFYRQGAVSTGIVLDSVLATADRDSLRVSVPMSRRGNAAFVGSVRASLRNGAGDIVATSLLPLGVYFTLAPRIAFSRNGLSAGLYSVVVEVISQRPDVAQRFVLPSASVVTQTPLLLVASRP